MLKFHHRVPYLHPVDVEASAISVSAASLLTKTMLLEITSLLIVALGPYSWTFQPYTPCLLVGFFLCPPTLPFFH